MEDEKEIAEQKEVLELTKNTRGYNWRIRLTALTIQPLADIDRLELINNRMKDKFSQEAIEDGMD